MDLAVQVGPLFPFLCAALIIGASAVPISIRATRSRSQGYAQSSRSRKKASSGIGGTQRRPRRSLRRRGLRRTRWAADLDEMARSQLTGFVCTGKRRCDLPAADRGDSSEKGGCSGKGKAGILRTVASPMARCISTGITHYKPIYPHLWSLRFIQDAGLLVAKPLHARLLALAQRRRRPPQPPSILGVRRAGSSGSPGEKQRLVRAV